MRLTAEQRRALEVLASDPHGVKLGLVLGAALSMCPAVRVHPLPVFSRFRLLNI
jgi:hypothetical protein